MLPLSGQPKRKKSPHVVYIFFTTLVEKAGHIPHPSTHTGREYAGGWYQQLKRALTLIRADCGIYDFRNFEEVYLCNGLSSELQNLCIPRKTSREYIL
jgi:hypothetical protein